MDDLGGIWEGYGRDIEKVVKMEGLDKTEGKSEGHDEVAEGA